MKCGLRASCLWIFQEQAFGIASRARWVRMIHPNLYKSSANHKQIRKSYHTRILVFHHGIKHAKCNNPTKGRKPMHLCHSHLVSCERCSPISDFFLARFRTYIHNAWSFSKLPIIVFQACNLKPCLSVYDYVSMNQQKSYNLSHWVECESEFLFTTMNSI